MKLRTGIYTFLFLFILISTQLKAQNYLERKEMLDVQDYHISIAVNDSTDRIDATAAITLQFLKPANSFYFDLTSQDESGKGMKVASVTLDGAPVPFSQEGDQLLITSTAAQGDTKTYTISYSGIPKDGLIISQNKFGDRTFFGDNWPNRAHNWFPGVDHPSDKAYFTFTVDAPTHYQVIANGELREEINVSDDITEYKWKTSVPLPTKVAVIGVAKFAVQNVTKVHDIEVSTWVYPENTDQGFHDYQPAADIVNFFIDYIGPYPYKKLANVQSKTRFGGMENASNIFYFENSVTGNGGVESLLAHEIAHQWFGNSASEIDWAHLWLSEGFATYMTDIYLENNVGEEEFREQLKKQRETVIKFYQDSKTPVVNTEETNYMRLLNANSYQKGGWTLHMLRNKIGDDRFHETIRKYYDTYKLSNASTTDFKNVAEQVSGQQLDEFFEQWLYKTGQPELKTSWSYKRGKLKLDVEQTQDSGTIFEFPLEIEVSYADGSSEMKTVSVSKQKESVSVDVKSEPSKITLDPNVKLLFEEVE